MNENIKIIIFDVDDTLIYTIDTAYKKTSLAGKKVYNMSLKKQILLIYMESINLKNASGIGIMLKIYLNLLMSIII